MGDKYTYEYVKETVSGLGYTLISEEYINIDSKLTFKDKYNYIYEMSFYGLKMGNAPQKFHPKNTHTISNIKIYLKINNLDFILISDVYKTNREKIILSDNLGYFYEITMTDLMSGRSPSRFHTSNSHTIHNIKLWLKLNTPNFTLISKEYINRNNKITLMDSDGYMYTVTLESLMNSDSTHRVSTFNDFAIQNIKHWCKLNSKKFKLISEQYKGSDSVLTWECLNKNCGEVFEMRWSNASQGCGCGYCSGKQVGLSNCLATKNPELAKEWHPTKNGDLTPYDVAKCSGKRVWWLCFKCTHEWETKISTRNSRKGCPNCDNKSKGEEKIRVLLQSHSISFIQQKEFDGLFGVGNGNLSYDFYLPKYNILIEFQGEQHEKPIRFKGCSEAKAQRKFIIQKEHDKRKKQYAIKHNIKLLEIQYYEIDNIEDILINELKIIKRM